MYPLTRLLLTANTHSVIGSVAERLELSAYDPFGSTPPSSLGAIWYNGEYREGLADFYLLGNGYRGYKPSIGRFCSPDNLSPFLRGGLNAYAYCKADPVNSRDPTGHTPMFFPNQPNRAFRVMIVSGQRRGAKDISEFFGDLSGDSLQQGIAKFSDASYSSFETKVNDLKQLEKFDLALPGNLQKKDIFNYEKLIAVMKFRRPQRILALDVADFTGNSHNSSIKPSTVLAFKKHTFGDNFPMTKEAHAAIQNLYANYHINAVGFDPKFLTNTRLFNKFPPSVSAIRTPGVTRRYSL
jgi:RHS repeat-associated protein